MSSAPVLPADRLLTLLDDATLVADAVVRMGRIGDSTILDDIEAARVALATGAVGASQIVNLQKSLSATIKSLSPITLNDIKRNPDWSRGKDSFGWAQILVLCFGIVLLTMTGVLSESYSRGISAYKNIVDFQSNNDSQQDLVKLASLLSSSRDGMIDAVIEKDSRASETLGLTLSNILLKQLRYTTLLKTSSEVETELNVTCYYLNYSCPPSSRDIDRKIYASRFDSSQGGINLSTWERIRQLFYRPEELSKETNGDRLVSETRSPNNASESDDLRNSQDRSVEDTVNQTLNFYSDSSRKGFIDADRKCLSVSTTGKCLDAELKSLSKLEADALRSVLEKKDLYTILEIMLFNYERLGSSTGITFRPLNPPDFSYQIYDLRKKLIKVGFWYLPFLYGMIGSLVFQARRILDPMSATPLVTQMFFRIFLGGFIGLIVIWVLNPNADNVVIPDFASFGVFALAFLFGFATEAFFLALDKVVVKATAALAS